MANLASLTFALAIHRTRSHGNGTKVNTDDTFIVGTVDVMPNYLSDARGRSVTLLNVTERISVKIGIYLNSYNLSNCR